MVRLPADYAKRYPHQLSGGEKQRVAIARAFAAEPALVICDEVTAALDVSVQATVAELLVKLQRDTGAACLFITHDLNLVRQIAHRIAVMQHGTVSISSIVAKPARRAAIPIRKLFWMLFLCMRWPMWFEVERMPLAEHCGFIHFGPWSVASEIALLP
jgi:ABC-type dipeptide/oligopeptide/nickel transport system ATPase subunit